jgi:hypothetical protein
MVRKVFHLLKHSENTLCMSAEVHYVYEIVKELKKAPCTSMSFACLTHVSLILTRGAKKA